MSILTDMADWARHAEDFWVAAGWLLALTTVSFFWAFYFFYRKRIIEDVPTSKIRSAAQGYVELTGIAELAGDSPIISPLTKSRCVWYSYAITEGSGKNIRTVESGTSDDLFRLVDDTGEVVIDPEKAEVTPNTADYWRGNNRKPQLGSNLRRGFFSGYGKHKSRFVGFGTYGYNEERIHPGDKLYAIGLFSTVGGASTEFNTNKDVGQLIREWKKNSEALLARFDTNKDGQIDMEEWQKVRAAALKEVRAEHTEQKAAKPIHMMSKTLDRRKPYILSNLPQSALTKAYTQYFIGLMISFVLMGTLSAWLIVARIAGA